MKLLIKLILKWLWLLPKPKQNVGDIILQGYEERYSVGVME